MKRTMSVILSVLLTAALAFAAFGTASADMQVTRVRTMDRGASLRDRPNGEKIIGVHANTELQVFGRQDGWFFVSYRNMTGWVSANMVVITGTGEVSGTPATYSDPTVPVVGNAVYGLNTKNETVRWVQNQLKATGIWYQGDEWLVSGNLGPHTMEAIAGFMETRGYHGHTGMINQTVINELYAYFHGGYNCD